MQKYANLSGNSGVVGFEIYPTSIDVKFIKSNRIYKYSYSSAGKQHVEKMKILALSGKGLSGYISQNVRDDFVK